MRDQSWSIGRRPRGVRCRASDVDLARTQD